MSNGIYCYIDKTNNKIVYVGKDNSINIHQRHKEHHFLSRKDKQVINKILQNNPDRYQYAVLIEGNFTDFILNELEKAYILHFNTYRPYTNFGFNFTREGDGSKGYSPSDEIKAKLSKSFSGKNNPMYGVHRFGEDNPMFGKHHSEKSKKKMSENRKKVAKYGREHHRCKWGEIDQIGGIEYIQKKKNNGSTKNQILSDLNISFYTLKRYLASYNLKWDDL